MSENFENTARQFNLPGFELIKRQLWIWALALATCGGARVAVAADFDLAADSVVLPASAAFQSAQSVQVVVKNVGDNYYFGAVDFVYSLDGVDVEVRHDTYISLAPGASSTNFVTGNADFSKPGTRVVGVRIVSNSDANSSNNSVTGTVESLPLPSSSVEISSFPYLQDFESGAANWTAFNYASGTPFVLGTPAKVYISGAASGTNAWVTGLSANYANNTRTQVISPVFDLNSMSLAEVSLNVNWESPPSAAGARLESSTDGGVTWETVGASGEPNNWFNNESIGGFEQSGDGSGWSGYFTAGSSGTPYASSGGYSSSGSYSGASLVGSDGYVPAKHLVTAGTKTKFRVVFASGIGNGDEGFAFDDFGVSSAAQFNETASLIVDANSDGIADPGDQIRYTVSLHNTSSGDFNNAVFADAIFDGNLSLVVGSVSTNVGSVLSGNSMGNTTVGVNVGTLATGSTATIQYTLLVGALSPSVSSVCTRGLVDADEFDATSTNDPGTSTGADSTCVEAFDSSAQLLYSGAMFSEANANDGTVSTVITATLSSDTFAVANAAMTSGVHYSVSNVPAGLSVVVIGTSSTTATIALSGTAAAHENANDVSNLTINFLDAAFSVRPASKVVGSSKSDFSVDFADAPATPTPTPTPTAQPTPTATATATPSVSPTPGPTATADRVEGIIVNTNGNPVQGVLVYLTYTKNDATRTSSVLTDSNGHYLFQNVGSGTVSVEPLYTGYTFNPATLSVTIGSAVQTIVASAVNLNSGGCELADFGEEIAEANNKGQAQLNFALGRVAKYTKAARKAHNAAVVKFLGGHRRALLRAYNALIEDSQTLPSITLSCNGKAGCTSQSQEATLKGFRSKLSEIRELTFEVLTQAATVVGEMETVPYTPTVTRLHGKAVRASRKLPTSTDSCN